MQLKRILVLEFHQETNTFNPIPSSFDSFSPKGHYEGQACFENRMAVHGSVTGAVTAIREAGGQAVPSIIMVSPSGGRVSEEVFSHALERIAHYLDSVGEIDGIYAALHGATCAVNHDDACGELLEFLRSKVGSKVIAASFDLHANITEKVLQNLDIICGYNTYPHVDQYTTGYRVGKFLMEYLAGDRHHMAAAGVDILIPPAGYTSLNGSFRNLMEQGKAMVESGRILDFTVFPVQPWLDIPNITSRTVTIGNDPEEAKRCADELAASLLAMREDAQPELWSVDAIIEAAEQNTSGKPVILADSADSPNGGCVGDSPVAAMALQKKNSNLRACMFVVDPASVKQAFALGVGGKGEFSVGAGFTKGMPGPFRAEGEVRSLHDGVFSVSRHLKGYLGLSAVVRFGSIDILLCCKGGHSGSPTIFRSFGMEPSHYDLVVVKANTSFRVPYASISDLIYVADTPGAGASNLKQLQWENLPAGRYPFDLPADYTPEKATLW